MLRFILGRLAGLVVTLVISSFVVFTSLYLAPGSPDAVLYGGRTPTPEARALIRAEYHLDDPFFTRYWLWLSDMLRGDLGTSVVGHQAVSIRIEAAAGTTIGLVTLATVFILVFGIGLGLVSGLGRPAIDNSVRWVTAVAVGIPSFVAATLLISFFAIQLGWFPSYGTGTGFFGRIYGYILPAIALSMIAGGLIARVTRAAVREEADKEYVLTSTARGVARSKIVARHILPNAIGPVLTVTGLQVASLLAGTVIVESAFGLNGLGSLLVSSVNLKDFPTVQAVTLILVSAFVIVNLVVDLIQATIDPRMRRAGTR